MMLRRRYLFAIGCVLIGVILVLVIWIYLPKHTGVAKQQTPIQKSAIPGNERQVVETFNHAAMKQDWATLYASTSQLVVGFYTETQFAQMMAQQVQEEGSISSVSVNSISQAKTNSDGATYFLANEQVTMTKNGLSHTQTGVAVYILEEGVWKFWFSK